MGGSQPRRDLAIDVGIAVGVAAIQLGGAALAGHGLAALGPPAYLLLLLGTLPLAFGRRAPIPVLLITALCALAYLLLGYPGLVIGLPVLPATYFAVLSGHRLVPLLVGGVLVAGLLAFGTSASSSAALRDVIESRVLLSGWLVAAGVMGEVARQRGAYVRQVEERALEAERTREEVARRRADEERLRIARELHDSLTHSISVVNVQAGVALHLARKRGEEVPPALLAIQESAREAMRELHDALDVLHRDEAHEVGMDRIPDLIRLARSAGLEVDLCVEGEPAPLPPATDRAAYRIVQEALTNVRRHARARSATVRVGYSPAVVTLQVEDDGCGMPDGAHTDGLGLRGMRERAAALAGRVEAGPRAGGGFSVTAELPRRSPA